MKMTIKSFLFAIAFLVLTACATNQTVNTSTRLNNQIVEASCGQCQFGMKDLKPNSCDLAIRVDGKSYFVDGAGIDDFGDAHASDGFCNAVRTARVSGTIDGNQFHATAFVLLPE